LILNSGGHGWPPPAPKVVDNDSLLDDRARRGAASIASRPRLRSTASDERSESDVPEEWLAHVLFHSHILPWRRRKIRVSSAQSPWWHWNRVLRSWPWFYGL